MRTHFCSCVGPRVSIWLISSSYYTCISFIFNPFPYNTSYPFWFVTYYSCSFFYDVNVIIPLTIYVPICFGALAEVNIQQPMIHFRILSQLLFWKMEHMFKRRSLTFFLATLNNEWISFSLETTSEPWWTLSLLTQLAQIWCNKHRQR